MDLLKTDDQHRSVPFLEDRPTDLDHVVRSNCKEETIECGMVKFAECDAVTDDRLALRIAVRNDVSSIKEFLMAKTA